MQTKYCPKCGDELCLSDDLIQVVVCKTCSCFVLVSWYAKKRPVTIIRNPSKNRNINLLSLIGSIFCFICVLSIIFRDLLGTELLTGASVIGVVITTAVSVIYSIYEPG